MKWPAWIAAPVIVALLAGCAGPRTDAPASSAVTPATTWRATGTAIAAEPLDAAWWRQFGDPVLVELIDTALAHNVDLAIAATRVEQVRAQYSLEQAQRLPNLAFAVNGGRQGDVDAFGRARRQTAGQAQFMLSYDLDLFGRLAQADEAARAALLASEAGRDTVRLAIAAATASSYIALRTQDARLAILRDTLAVRVASLQLVKRRVGAGYTAQLDLRQAEAEFSATEQLLAATALAIRRQENALSLLLGSEPRAVMRGVALAEMRIPAVEAGLPAQLLRRRPDIFQAEQQLVAADHTLDAARAAFMPNIKLGLAGGYADSSLIPAPISIFSIGGSILAPLFDGRLPAQADAATARRNEAAFAYRKAALTAVREVEDALAQAQDVAVQEQAIAAQRQALSLALETASNRYRSGYSPYLEQLDAQRGLLSAELLLVQLHADRLLASVSLFQALGGGWSPVPEQ